MEPALYEAIRKAHAKHGLEQLSVQTVGTLPGIRPQVVGKGIREYQRHLAWREQALKGEPRPPSPRDWQIEAHLMARRATQGESHAVD